jgi:methylated-DNA-[protein]-cysteine S-methyltransferase
MSANIPTCREIERELVATAMGEGDPGEAERLQAHLAMCAPCRGELDRYGAIDRVVGEIRRAPVVRDRSEALRGDLAWRLAELRRRTVTARVWSSPLGPILIARSEQGVVAVEYLESARGAAASRVLRRAGIEIVEEGSETESFYQQLLEYLSGERTRLAWPLDLRLAHSEFQREVLQATAALPYGAVVSYAHLAREIGRPTATRAVAQALRHNPLPIVVPCHRVVGSSGALTGYAGNKLGLKEQLLTLEGVPLAGRDRHIVRGAMYLRADHYGEYCLPTCGALPTVPLWRLTLFGSRERAEAAGLAPCQDCRPDLHPISGPTLL